MVLLSNLTNNSLDKIIFDAAEIKIKNSNPARNMFYGYFPTFSWVIKSFGGRFSSGADRDKANVIRGSFIVIVFRIIFSNDFRNNKKIISNMTNLRFESYYFRMCIFA